MGLDAYVCIFFHCIPDAQWHPGDGDGELWSLLWTKVATLYGPAQRPNLLQTTSHTHCLYFFPDPLFSFPFLCPSQYTLISKPHMSSLLHFLFLEDSLASPIHFFIPSIFHWLPFYFPSLGGVCSYWEGTHTMIMNTLLCAWSALTWLFWILQHQLWNLGTFERVFYSPGGELVPERSGNIWRKLGFNYHFLSCHCQYTSVTFMGLCGYPLVTNYMKFLFFVKLW